MENKEKIKRAIDGNEEAFLELLMENYNQLYKCAYYYLGNKEDAMDAMQEMALRAFKSRKKLKKDSTNIKGWFTRILVNYCRDKIKKRCRIIPIEDIFRAKDSIEYQEDFQEEFIENDMINRVVHHLKSPYREVLILRYFQDMKISDIAFVMGKPITTIKSQIKRAETLCRRILEEENSHVG